MEVLVVSSEKWIKEEAKQVNALLDNGLKVFHLRKPGSTANELRKFLLQIKEMHWEKIVVHQFHELASEFQLKGIHVREELKRSLGAKLKSYTRGFHDQGFSVSASFHSREDLVNNKTQYDYCFLSPVFTSISKEDYPGKGFDVSELKAKIYALGGVSMDKIEEAYNLGYHGIALLGTVWNTTDSLSAYLKIKKALVTYGFKNTPNNSEK